MTGATPVWDPPFHRNFGRLVLSCIDASDSESRRIFQHFSRSTRFASLCTAPNSEILEIFVKLFRDFFEKNWKIPKILRENKKKSKIFEYGAVRRNANLVDLEKAAR